MKKIVLTYLLFQLSLKVLWAFQMTGSFLSGMVLDETEQPAFQANVILYNSADSVMIKGEVVGADGRFTLSGFTEGSYWVEISYLGYEPYCSQPINLQARSPKDIGTIRLNRNVELLSEVTVTAQRPLIEVQPDKTVFNVDGSINAAGNTALELLRKSPGVIIDNNDNIMLSGKSGVRIYVDGKPSFLSGTDLAALLSSMQSAEIDAIEVITNPGAKYEAEGNAGIINIRLKKDKNMGSNANVNMGYSQGTYAKYNTSLTFNSRSKKMNLFGTYSHNDGEYRSWLSLYRTQGDFIYDDYTTTESGGAYNSIKIGADYFAGDNHTVGFIVNSFANNRDWINYNQTPILRASSGERVSFLEAISDNDGIRRRLNANLNYRFDNKNSRTWNVDVDWGIFRNDNATFQPNYYRTPDEEQITQENIFTASTPTDIDIYTIQADHKLPLEEITLEIGARMSYVRTNNTYDFYEEIDDKSILDIERSNNFLFDEHINAAYISAALPYKKFNFNAGLRMEQTLSEGTLTARKLTANDQVKRNYIDFFPSIGVTFNPDRKNQLRINYNQRIDRPNYQDLNPFEFKLSELSYSRGNPFLSPQYTQSISLAHTHNYQLTTSITYSHTEDFFANISDSTEVIRTFLETINLDYRKVLSLNISYPFSPTEKWSTYTSFTAFNTRNRAQLGPGRLVDLSATVASLYHQSTLSLPKDFSFELSGWYSSPSIWGAVYEVDANFSIDTGFQKKFASGRGSIKLSVTDIFNSASWTAIQDFAGFYVDAAGGWESRQIRLNLSYTLGNNQLKRSKTRKEGLEQEASRIQ